MRGVDALNALELLEDVADLVAHAEREEEHHLEHQLRPICRLVVQRLVVNGVVEGVVDCRHFEAPQQLLNETATRLSVRADHVVESGQT